VALLDDLLDDAQRQVTICNACRYCEGYCAAFPAMELREELRTEDLSYIANLCHDCRACYQACPYTEPHDFAINIPSLLSTARVASYTHYAQPSWLSRAFSDRRFTLVLATSVAVMAIITMVVLALIGRLIQPPHHTGDFYAVISYDAMMLPALGLSLYGVGVVALGCMRFMRDVGLGRRNLSRSDLTGLLGDVMLLRWMRGGGAGCHYPDPHEPSTRRRWLHQIMAAGFVSAFAATVVAAIEQDLLGVDPPYALLSAPVVLGLLGGVGVLLGTGGLLALKRRDDRTLGDRHARQLDYALLWGLLAVATTGVALLVMRHTGAMGVVLVAHLACVAFLFVLMPYGKFVHAAYRTAALLLWQRERRELER
jgi:citrate/tricarballylate utilization protein